MRGVATAARAVLWAAGLALGLLLLSSLVRQPLTPLQSWGLALFAVFALARPRDALLVFAAFGPLIGVIGAVFEFAFGGTRLLDTIALLLLVPWIALQARGIRNARWRSLDWALLGFAIVVATSAAAHLPSVALRTGVDAIPRALWEFFTEAYLDHPAGFEVVTQAVLLLEGIGLCALVSRLAADPLHARRVTGMVITGATAAAVMNVYRLVEVAARRGPLSETLGATFSSLRINTQFGDVNAAGSYFAMAVVAAAGLSDFRSLRGWAYIVSTAPLALAVWLSGSRTALSGAVLGVAATVLVRHRSRAWLAVRSRKRLVVAAALAIAVAAALTILPKARSATVAYSVFARTELAATAFRMLQDRPLLGVGVSRYYELFPLYASPELRRAFFESALIPVVHENAHNNFLQILAELGIVGLAAYLAVLWLALRPDTLLANSTDSTVLRSALVIAAGTFLFTSLFGHPLLTHEVAYPFWIVLGLAAARAFDHPDTRSSALLRPATIAIAILLVGTLPIRAGYERRHANLEGIALGMSNWQRDEAGNRFRWARPRSTLFIDSRLRVVRLPLRASASTTCAVEIRIDGRAVDRLTIPSDFWQDVRLRLPPPPSTQRAYRVELMADERCRTEGADVGRTLMVGRPEEFAAPSGAAPPR